MTLQQLAKEKALDTMFTSRPNLPTDWDIVMGLKGYDCDGFGDGFVVWVPFSGYTNDYVCMTLRFLYEDLFGMAQYAIEKVYALAGKELANTNETNEKGD
jgi:hypothetical protein